MCIAEPTAPMPPPNRTQNRTDYGTRTDGSPKGSGFLGELKRPDGNVSTELATSFEVDGEEFEAPLLVPTLSAEEVEYLLKDGTPTKAIEDKALEHALERKAQGLSPFKD